MIAATLGGRAILTAVSGVKCLTKARLAMAGVFSLEPVARMKFAAVKRFSAIAIV